MDPKHLEEMISYRRKFHQFPEEGWTEFETTYFIVSKIKTDGIRNHLDRETNNQSSDSNGKR